MMTMPGRHGMMPEKLPDRGGDKDMTCVSSLAFILSAPPADEPIHSPRAFWKRHLAALAEGRSPIDEAILGGFSADRLGYAFAAGYHAALRALAPDLPPTSVVSLCITEQGGGHPRAILTKLHPDGESHYRIEGHKRWATLSGDANILLVAASEGLGDQGKNRIRIVRVDAAAAGIILTPMTETLFAPEIVHSEVTLAGVRVGREALLPGDGYDRYIKPFRTIEDIHVHAALLAYLIRESRRHQLSRSIPERLASLLSALSDLAAREPDAPSVHIALAGALSSSAALVKEIEEEWARTESLAYSRWQRDRPLLGVAERARSQRLDRAWERSAPSGAD
jgi:acyl-CoA dehydrogenase